MAVWYASPYFCEEALVRARHLYLGEAVSVFVWGESDVTTQGDPNPYHFPESEKEANVLTLRVPQISEDPREQEDLTFQTWATYVAAQCQDEDLIILSDADELIRREAITQANEQCVTYLTLQQYYFCYHPSYLRQVSWRCAKVFRGRFLKSLLRQGVLLHVFRHLKYEHPLRDAGWHLTNFGGSEMVAVKHRSFRHAKENRLSYEEGMRTMKTPAGHPLVRVNPLDYFPSNLLDLLEVGYAH